MYGLQFNKNTEFESFVKEDLSQGPFDLSDSYICKVKVGC